VVSLDEFQITSKDEDIAQYLDRNAGNWIQDGVVIKWVSQKSGSMSQGDAVLGLFFLELSLDIAKFMMSFVLANNHLKMLFVVAERWWFILSWKKLFPSWRARGRLDS